MPPIKTPIGVRRLDDLLGGGAPLQSCALLYGPPFIGKEVLARLFFLNGLRQGIPGVLVLTGDSASDVRKQLAETEPRYPEWEKAGLAQFIDTYSSAIGAEDSAEMVQYVDGSVNLNALSLAVNDAQRRIIGDHAHHRLVVDSVSTLVTYTNAQTCFRFLQVLVGKAKRAGATSLLLLEHGMHADAEVQMFKHLTDGVVELKHEGDNLMLNVIGLGVTENPGWVEYRFTERSLEILGSFAAGRIR